MRLSAKNKIFIYSIIQYKMPKLPINYSNTTIYKLVHKEDYDNANTYIGSTTDFIRRKNNHKNNCNNEKNKEYNDKKYQYIRDNGGWGDWNMLEVEKFPCNDKREAEAREEYWRCHFNSQLNTKRAYITDKQRLEKMRERYETHKDKYREYYEKNKDKYREYQRVYQKQYNYNKKKSIEDLPECFEHC